MGNTCCDNNKDYQKWKALRIMNQQGVYTPIQIQEFTEKNWKQVVKPMQLTVDHNTCLKIVEATVNELGLIGD